MTDYKQPVFRKDWYIDALKHGPIALFNRIKLDIKWAYQRVQRGFSDYDADDIDIWFEYVMLGIIQSLKNSMLDTECRGLVTDEDIKYYKDTLKQLNVSEEDFSCWNTGKVSEDVLNQIQDKLHQRWMNTLDKLIYLFTEMNEDECSKKDELSEDELKVYCDQKRKEALKMFNTYFHSLWL